MTWQEPLNLVGKRADLPRVSRRRRPHPARRARRVVGIAGATSWLGLTVAIGASEQREQTTQTAAPPPPTFDQTAPGIGVARVAPTTTATFASPTTTSSGSEDPAASTTTGPVDGTLPVDGALPVDDGVASTPPRTAAPSTSTGGPAVAPPATNTPHKPPPGAEKLKNPYAGQPSAYSGQPTPYAAQPATAQRQVW